jgi:hypothetical protein
MPRRQSGVDTSIIYCGDCLDQLMELSEGDIIIVSVCVLVCWKSYNAFCAAQYGPVTTKLCRMANDFTENAFCQKFEPSKPRIQAFLELSR